MKASGVPFAEPLLLMRKLARSRQGRCVAHNVMLDLASLRPSKGLRHMKSRERDELAS